MGGEIEDGALYPSLKDRSVFITGGGSGIGESLVEHFCAQGSRFAFVDIPETPARALVERIAATGDPKPHFILCDLREIDRLRSAIAEASERNGAIRVVWNNAGNDDRHRSEVGTPQTWDC